MPAQGFGLLLAPGASAGAGQPGLVAIDLAASALGFRVRRMDFAYRLAGRRVPDRPEVLVAAVEDAARCFVSEEHLDPKLVFSGGRSMGGRICSMAVAKGMPSAGLVLVSYPLHAPGRPEQLRTSHFRFLALPCLFVSGTKDVFATPAELEKELAAIPGPVTLQLVQGADHGMRRHDNEVAEVVARWLARFQRPTA